MIQLESVSRAGSGLAASKDGLKLSLGYMGESVCFVPHGAVRELQASATALPDTDARVLSIDRRIFCDLPCNEDVSITLEDTNQNTWMRSAATWLPQGETWSCHERVSVPGADKTLGPGVNAVDFILLYRTLCVLAVELKNSTISVFDAVSQVALAGAAAALALLAAGVPVEHCVVPVITHTGLAEQHGAVFLLKPSTPVYVALSPILDLFASPTRLMAAKFRVMAARHVESLARTHLSAFDPCLKPLSSVCRPGTLSLTDYFFKTPKQFFGTDENVSAITALHELRVFEQLATAGVVDVVYPAARLIKHVGTDKPQPVWLAGAAMVYPNIAPEGFKDGLIPDPQWLQAVTTAVNSVHAAGVVHVDLWPCNIMSKHMGDGTYVIKLVDFEASLFVGEPVPSSIVSTIARNGCRRIYHPDFVANTPADVAFDRWFLVAFALFIEKGLDSAIWTQHTELGDFFTEHKQDLLDRLSSWK